MAVTTFNDEYTSPIATARIFKASILDSHNLVPKLIPHIKSIQIIQGNGGAGSINQINFADGSLFSTLKYHVDEQNEETFTYKYTVIEGGVLQSLNKDLEKITYEGKFESSPDAGAGSIYKVTSNYYTKGDLKLNEDDIKAGKEKAVAIYKAAETYLVQNPDAYA